MARSLNIRIRFPFFRFSVRMGDAQVDAEMAASRSENMSKSIQQLGPMVAALISAISGKPTSSFGAEMPPDADRCECCGEPIFDETNGAGNEDDEHREEMPKS